MTPRSVPFLLSFVAAAACCLPACGGDDAAQPAAAPAKGGGGNGGSAGKAGGSAGVGGGNAGGVAGGKAGSGGATAGASGSGASGSGGFGGVFTAGSGGSAGGGATSGSGGAAGASAGSGGVSAGAAGASAGASGAGTGGSTAGSAGKAGQGGGTGGAAGSTAGTAGGGGSAAGAGAGGEGGAGSGGGVAASGAGGAVDPCGAGGCKEVDFCADFKDQDGNGRIDCDDKPCKNTAGCASKPGAKKVGDTCSVAADCRAAGGDPACLVGALGKGDPDRAFERGYCSEWCDLGTALGCSAGSFCVNAQSFLDGIVTTSPSSGRGLCAKSCSDNTQCPALTFCSSAGILGGPSGCAPRTTERCVNGADDNNDGLLDCLDPKCAKTHAACTGGEKVCADFVDEDENGLTDCSDAKCKATATCEASGFKTTGAPCTKPSDCGEANRSRACVAEATDPAAAKFAGGYCSEWCQLPEATGCAAGSICVEAAGLRAGDATRLFPSDPNPIPLPLPPLPPSPPRQGLCADQCATTDDCRAFYVCVPRPNAAAGGVCLSRHDEQCTNNIDDNHDGKADCKDPQCAAHPACTGGEKNCNDLIDEDEDGLTDCRDEDCKKTSACAKGFIVAGGPCAAPSACNSVGGDPSCLLRVGDVTFTDGYCSEWCDAGTGTGCADGARCADRAALQRGEVVLSGGIGIPGGEGLCLDTCTEAKDCRPLYVCKGNACFPQPTETCGNGVDDNNDGKTDCADSACLQLEACKLPLGPAAK